MTWKHDLIALALGVWIGGCSIAVGHASDDPAVCDHRGYMHITRHGGKEADDEWHRRHGQSVTCDDDKSKDDPNRDDDPEEPRHLPGEDDRPHEREDHHGDGKAIPRRDHEGYACTYHGCG